MLLYFGIWVTGPKEIPRTQNYSENILDQEELGKYS